MCIHSAGSARYYVDAGIKNAEEGGRVYAPGTWQHEWIIEVAKEWNITLPAWWAVGKEAYAKQQAKAAAVAAKEARRAAASKAAHKGVVTRRATNAVAKLKATLAEQPKEEARARERV